MSKFERSEWAEQKHARDFIENADIYIMERKTSFTILKAFYRHYLLSNGLKGSVKVLDLGCGDGTITRELLSEHDNMEVTLVDGSSEMLESARKNLGNLQGMNFINKTFQELLENHESDDILPDKFDFVVSSLAIHHLQTAEKKALFKYIYHHLKTGGFFLNIDVVKAPTRELESWYRILWSEWIQENQAKLRVEKNFEDLPLRYKDNEDNNPDKLQVQLDALESVGFKQVDCYYKYGIFSMYGGKK